MNKTRETRCEACDAPVPIDEKLCTTCKTENTKRTKMKSCAVCGAQNLRDDTRCHQCKSPLRISSIPPTPPPVDTTKKPTIVGRGAELQVLEDCFLVCSEKKQVGGAIIAGDPGMGSTTLLKSFAKLVSGKVSPTRIVYVVTNESEPFSPLRGILLQWLSIPQGMDPMQRRIDLTQKVRRALHGESPARVAETAHLLGYLVGIEFPESPVLRTLQSDPNALERAIKGALKSFFSMELANEPGIFLLDETHRASKETIGLILDLLESLGSVTLAVVTAGDHSVINITDNPSVVRIRLEPLDDSPMRRLFQQFLPRLVNPPQTLVKAIVERAAGNPGSLHHLCELLKETGIVDTSQNPWKVDKHKMAKAQIPVNLTDALKARIKQLDPRDRVVLEHAAVFGEMFWDETIVAFKRNSSQTKHSIDAGQIWIDDSDTLTVSSALSRLVDRQFIVQLVDNDVPGCIKYAFAKAGIRDEINRSLSAKSRQEGHRLAAEWLALVAGRYGSRFAEAEAAHWLAAGDKHRSGLAFLEAARYAKTKHLNQKSIHLFERALELIDQSHRLLLIDAQHDLGSVFELLGQYEPAEKCFTEMLRHAWILVHRGKAGAAMNKIGRLYRARGDGPAAAAFLNRAMAIFKTAGDEKGVAACLGDLGELARRQGSYDRAFELVDSALELQRKLGNTPSVAVCLHGLGHIEAARASYKKAEIYLREALVLRQQADDKGGMAQTLSTLAIVLFSRGDIDEAIAHWQAALQLAEEVGDRRMVAIALNNLGEAFRDQGKLELSMKHFQACEDAVSTLDDRLLQSEVSRNMGILAQRMGNLESARSHLERSLEMAVEVAGKELEGLTLRALGDLESATVWDTSKVNTEDAAETLYSRSLDIFQTIGNEFETARTLHARGNRRLERGDVVHAKRDLEDAKEIFMRIDSKAGEKVKRTIREILHTPKTRNKSTRKGRNKNVSSMARLSREKYRSR